MHVGSQALSSPERELALRLAAGDAHRRRMESDLRRLRAQCDPDRLLALLANLRTTALFGGRLLEVGGSDDPEVARSVALFRQRADEAGGQHELITLGLLSALQNGGVTAMGLKGSLLSRQLYGSPGARATADIDILVDPADVPAALAILTRTGWHRESPTPGSAPSPLHESLVHPALPRVELHWRIHWYENQFSTDALKRATQSGRGQPLVMNPTDGMVALALFYARDGFTGLRLPADAAQWWELRCDGASLTDIFRETSAEYPELARPLSASAHLLGRLVGLPSGTPRLSRRGRLALTIATPFSDRADQQLVANAAFVDLLLAPSSGEAAAIHRESAKVSVLREPGASRLQRLSAHVPRWMHLLRLWGRWALALTTAGRAIPTVEPIRTERT